jgi:hypothetical protein
MMKKLLLVLALLGMVVFASSAFTVSANGDCQFTLFGTAQPDTDPENPSNEVISIDPTDPSSFNDFGGVRTTLPAGTQAEEIDNQVSFKYYFVPPRTCTAGSPRIQLRIDSDGDGDGDFNAFGHPGPLGFGAGCVTGAWTFADLTDSNPRWDLSQGGGGMNITWDAMELFLAATYPNYQILTGSLVEDGYPGKAYFDLITIGDCTLDGTSDIAVGPPTSVNQCKDGGWQNFNAPRTFRNQGDCMQFVNTGK